MAKIQKPTIKDVFNFSPNPVFSPGFSLRTLSLPNGGGSYATPMPQSTPMFGPGVGPSSFGPGPTASAAVPFTLKPTGPTGPAPVAPSAPLFSGAPTGATGPTGPASAPQVPAQWLKPGGGFYTPDEIAANIAKAAPNTGANGDVGKLAADEFSNKTPTAAELQAKATLLNNAKNDIAVGANDPYKVASESGIAYTPQELDAIENAYAGVYKPALTTALAKLSEKQTQDKNKADAEAQNNAPFTLGKDQVRYDSKGNPIAVGISTDNTGAGGTYTPGTNPVVDAYVKGFGTKYKASDIPDQYKDLVAQGVASTAAPISENSKSAISVIDQLLKPDANLNAITGIPGPSAFFPGTKAAQTETLAKQLSAMLSLENRQQLKGSGAISDFEFKVLSDAASSLGIDPNTGRSNLSNGDFLQALKDLKNKLDPTALSQDEIDYLKSKNYTDDQIQAFQSGGQTSFNDVGNTKASGNRPQRNNNPGNVKSGGLADSLAIGKDEQGHLVFPDPQTGFKALTADITAKINGGSSHLPPNPTIEQLAKVYAEDPGWGVKVAKIVGVPVTTHTQNIPIANLVKAIATQEGFYA